MDQDFGRIVVKLPQPLGSGSKTEIIDTKHPFAQDVQRVKDFESFSSFASMYGVSIVYRRPSGTVNPIIQRWFLTGNPDADLSRELLQAVSEGRIGVRLRGERKANKIGMGLHIFNGDNTDFIDLEGEGLDTELSHAMIDHGKKIIEASIQGLGSTVSLDAVWDGDKKELRVLETTIEPGLMEFPSMGKRGGTHPSIKDLRLGPELTRKQLMAVWREEANRFVKIRRDIARVSMPEEELGEGSLTWLKKDRARLQKYLRISNRHLKGISLDLFADKDKNISLMLIAPTLESATFLAIFLKLSAGLDYVKCKRRACSNFFWTTDPRKEYCDRSCKEKKQVEELSPLAREKKRLTAIVNRREIRWMKTKNGIDPDTAMAIRTNISNAGSRTRLAAIEKEYRLHRERETRRAKTVG